MFKHDNRLIAAIDLPAAIGLLTRFPVTLDTERATARGARAAWAYPLVGVILGVIFAAATALLKLTGLPAGIIAGLVLAGLVIVTGAMHEDGLADSADGLWGGWDKARRLAIMKDSHIGVYGVCAIALSLLLRWLSLVVIISVGAYWVGFIACFALSRAAMVLVMGVLPNARGRGLSQSVGRPTRGAVWLAIILSSGIAIGCGLAWAILPAILATAACAAIARAKIGGQTGDILGATEQVVQMTVLISLTTMIT